MTTPRSYTALQDLEYGYTNDDSDEDNSKQRRKNPKVRWRSYSRGVYTIGLIICTVILLYMGVIQIMNRVEMNLSSYATAPMNENAIKLMIVADLDKKSREKSSRKGKWKSILKKAELRKDENGIYSVSWLEDQEIFTKFSEAGRGMELSALVEFNNHLYTFDDRSGIVFELIKGNKAIPRFILMEGDGETTKGQKTEWATIKDNCIYAGSFGKEYTRSDGTIASTNNMWISIINAKGNVTHVNWTENYNKLRNAVGVPYPGYMIHEAISWSSIRKQWVILPRRVSKEAYDENEDEKKGSNVVILASEDFDHIEVKHITPVTPTRGFSDFKFLPGSGDSIIVALKSEENEENQTQNSYITIFDLDGTILMKETEIPGNHKFEGLEFFYF